jgi:hypothetical protein
VNDNKNLILAVVLSALVLLGWTWAANRYFPTANPPSTRVQNGKQVALPQPQAQPVPSTPKALQDRAQVLASSPRIRIDTPSLQGLHRAVRLDGAGCRGAGPQHGVAGGQQRPDTRPAGHAEHSDAGRRALPDQDRGG